MNVIPDEEKQSGDVDQQRRSAAIKAASAGQRYLASWDLGELGRCDWLGSRSVYLICLLFMCVDWLYAPQNNNAHLIAVTMFMHACIDEQSRQS